MTSFVSSTAAFLSRQSYNLRALKCTPRRFLANQPSMNLIEVESRFKVTSQAKDNILQFAGTCQQLVINDRYYSQQLALRDKWLRQRNEKWELKVPVDISKNSDKKAVVYKELIGSAVMEEIHKYGMDLNHLDEYANILTNRSQWMIDMSTPWAKYNIQITADECSSPNGYRYDIGEIEILVDDEGKVKDASKAIQFVCDKLDLHLITNCGGKLITYIYEKNRKLYNKLLEKGLA